MRTANEYLSAKHISNARAGSAFFRIVVIVASPPQITRTSHLDEIADIVTRKYQTLAYFGFEKNELEEFVLRNRLTGIDRIVPLGDTTAFSLIWDGNDLINTMSRVVDIK